MATIRPSNPPHIFPWAVMIDHYAMLAKLCCLSDNFSTFETLLAINMEASVGYTTALNDYNVGSEAADPIKQYNIECVQTAQASYNTFSTTVSSLQTTGVQVQTWAQTIDDAAMAAKEACSNAIDSAANRAKNYISTLPEHNQKAIADLFVAGLNVVLNFIATVWKKIQEIANNITQFLEGVWDILTNAATALSTAATCAISLIRGDVSNYSSISLIRGDNRLNLQTLLSSSAASLQ